MSKRGDRRRAKERRERRERRPVTEWQLGPERFDGIPVVDGPVRVVPEISSFDRSDMKVRVVALWVVCAMALVLDWFALRAPYGFQLVDFLQWCVLIFGAAGFGAWLWTEDGVRFVKQKWPLTIDEIGIAAPRPIRWSEQRAVVVRYGDRHVFVDAHPTDMATLTVEDWANRRNCISYMICDDTGRVVAALRTFVPPRLLTAEPPPPRVRLALQRRPLPRARAAIVAAQALGVTFAAMALCVGALLLDAYHLYSGSPLLIALVAAGITVLGWRLYRGRWMPGIIGMLAVIFCIQGSWSTAQAAHSVVLSVDGHPVPGVIKEIGHCSSFEIKPAGGWGLGFRIRCYRVDDLAGNRLPGGVWTYGPGVQDLDVGSRVTVIVDATGRFDIRLPDEVELIPDGLRALADYVLMYGLLYGGFSNRWHRTNGAIPGRGAPAKDDAAGTAARPRAPATEG